MVVLRDPASTNDVRNRSLRSLIEQRFIDICEEDEYDPDIHGYFLVVEPGDSSQALEAESGCPILRSLVGNARFGDPHFQPCFEYLEEHEDFYELVFVPGGGDFGIVVFIPKQEGVDPDLLAMCAEYAIPAP